MNVKMNVALKFTPRIRTKLVRISWSPDGRYRVAGGKNGTIFVWDTQKDTQYDFPAHDDWDGADVFGLDWLPDGTLVSSGQDHTIRFWSLGGKLGDPDSIIYPIDHNPKNVPFSHIPNPTAHKSPILSIATRGWLVASGSLDGEVKLWSAKQLNAPSFVCDVYSHRDWVTTLKWMEIAGSYVLASGSYDGTIYFWSLASTSSVRSLPLNSGRINEIALNQDGLIAVGSEKGVRVLKFEHDLSEIINVEKGSVLELPNDIKSIVFSSDGLRMAVGPINNSAIVINVKGWTQILEIHQVWQDAKQIVGCMAFNPVNSSLDFVSPDQYSIASNPIFEDIGVKGAGENDLETDEDRLGFDVYVRALALFLSSPHTQPPLTVSLEGAWGMGKSSFMRMLRKALEDEEKTLLPAKKQNRASKLIEQQNEMEKEHSQRLIDAWQNLSLRSQTSSNSAAKQPETPEQISRQKDNGNFQPRKTRRNTWQNKTGLILKFIAERSWAIFDFIDSLFDYLFGFWIKKLFQLVKNWLWPTPNMYVVLFNPWHYQNANELWAAFALEFMKQVGEQAGFMRRTKRNLVLGWQTFNWKDGLPHLFRFFVQLVVLTVVIAALYWGISSTALTDIGFAADDVSALKALFSLGRIPAIIALGLALWQQYQQYFGSPSLQLQRYISSPDYKEQMGFFQQFRSHFRKVMQAYMGGDDKRIYVFFDDLDRCDPHVAAELMQSISMLSADNLPLISILAMDRAKVAASLAVRYQDLMPFLPVFEQAKITDADKNRLGRDYGYEFVEKFVQIMFRLPRSGESDIRNYVKHLTGRIKTKGNTAQSNEPDRNIPANAPESNSSNNLTPERIKILLQDASASHPMSSENIRTRVEDSQMLEREVNNIAWVFDNNPRKIKIFTNMFRLRAYIMESLGLLRLPPEPLGDGISATQLAKMVAISIAWPQLVDDLRKDKSLLHRFYHEHPSDGKSADDYLEQQAVQQAFERDQPDNYSETPPVYNSSVSKESPQWMTWRDTQKVQKLLFEGWDPQAVNIGISNILLNNPDILLKSIE